MTKMVQDLMVEVGRIHDCFHRAVYDGPDVDAAMAVTAADAVLVNLPMDTGASGEQDLRRYLADEVAHHLPADLAFRRLSVTVDRWRVAEQAVVEFTHDRELPWLLPGVAPTHRRAQVLAISVVSVSRSLITSHRTLWDHSGLLAQLRLDPAEVGTRGSASWGTYARERSSTDDSGDDLQTL